MTDDQVNLVVQHLCEQLHLALRSKGSEAHRPNAKDTGFDPASVRTVLLTGLRSAGAAIHHEQPGRAKSRRGPKRKTRDRSPAPILSVGSKTERRPAAYARDYSFSIPTRFDIFLADFCLGVTGFSEE